MAETDELVEQEIARSQKLAKKGERGKDTLFRVTIRNQIDQISIADNKANMIISINTIIVSLVIAFLGSGFGIEGVSFLDSNQVIIPLTILMLASVISAIFSILAARPRIINSGSKNGNASIFFFGSYKNLSLEDYIEKMEGVMDSNTEIYRNLVIDMYNNGQVLSRKYRLLWLAYTFFLLGIVLAAVSYFVIGITN